ncbi:response regulator transcription factor [Sulfuricurvum sp.]|uniref:response regulator transcription factor n=1 Tax=Sulfuricurvum sp. TaxID=2025608 RepID=UPI0035664E6F
MINNILLLKDKRVLFCDDDAVTRTQIIEVLQMLFGQVYSAQNGEEAYQLYQDESPDIILTDIKMPKKDGLALIKLIRQNDYNLPIILMTSFAEQNLLVSAANLSIDGYLVKPVNLEKLTTALAKAMQRTHKEIGLIPLAHKLFYNAATKELYHNGIVVELGSKEQELLVLLINNRHKTVTKEEIEKKLWPLDPICESGIKNIILRLRKKLGINIIVSVRGIGYRLDAPRSSI